MNVVLPKFGVSDMNKLVKLTPRENQMAEYLAWGATKKEIANFLTISTRTVENTARSIFEKTGVTKVNELAAWWFCSNFNISMDLSPMKRRIASMAMLLLVVFQLFNPNESNMRARRAKRVRKSETEYIDYLNN